ncbi:MAG TPA: hypothetical protein VF540_03850, partial [Segetibacter sp.]
LQIASSQSSSPVFALKATDERQALLNRIKRMIERKEKTFFNYKHQVLALIVMTTVLSALALFSKKNTLFTVKPSGLLTPLVAKVDHPLFNPVFFLLNNSTELNPIELDAKINKGEKEVAALKRSKDSTTTNITNIKEDRTEKNLQQLRKPFASAKRDVLLPVIEEPEFTERMPVASNDVDQTGKASFLIDLESYGNAQKFFSRLSEIVFADQQGAALKQHKVLQELEKAAKKLHALKFEKELEKLDAASADFKNAGAEEKMAVVRLKNEGWKTLAKQFQQQVGEVKIEMNKIANLDIIESDQYNREVRQPVSANVEKVRGFSFEFSEAPRVKINLPIIYQRQPKRLDKKKSAACEEDSYKEMRIDELPDRSSVRPVTKRIMVIRI